MPPQATREQDGVERIWCALQGHHGCPLMGCPLAVFQGGQILLPSSECVVSTGDSQEHLAALAAPWGHPHPFLPSIIRPMGPSRKGVGDLSRQNPYILFPQFFVKVSLRVMLAG